MDYIKKEGTKEEQKQRLIEELYWATEEAAGADAADSTLDDFISVNNERLKTMTIEEIQEEIEELQGEDE